jgi:hypothetical protein
MFSTSSPMVFAKAPQLAKIFDGDLPNFPKCSKRYCNIYHNAMIPYNTIIKSCIKLNLSISLEEILCQ